MHLLPKVILLIVRTLSQRNLSAGLLSSPSGKLIVRLDGMDKKCRLGTDSTFGAWLRAHSAWDGAEGGGEHQQEVVAEEQEALSPLLLWICSTSI